MEGAENLFEATRLNWDDPLPECLKETWQAIYADLQEVKGAGKSRIFKKSIFVFLKISKVYIFKNILNNKLKNIKLKFQTVLIL